MVLTGMFAGVVANTVWADELHYNNILIGDRASGMAGAYTAISDDPSGLYYNPAGAVYSTGRNLSASVNAYQETRTHYKKVLGGNGYHRRSSSVLPNFFGTTQPIGKAIVGFSYAVPDSIEEDQDQVFRDLPSSLPGVYIDRYVINFNNTDETFLLGPSLAYPLSKSFSVGGTLYGHYRHRETILNQVISLSDGRYQWANSYFETTEYGVRPLLGAMWSPHDKMALGLSASKVLLVKSNAKSQRTHKGEDFDANTLSWTPFETDEKRELPLTTTLGVAFFPSNALIFSWDVSYYDETKDVIDGVKEATWNTALGLEYYLSDRWAVRAGYFTNKANSAQLDRSRINQSEHIDMDNGTLSISRFTGNTSMTMGLGYGFGKGEAQLFGNSLQIQEVERETMMFYLSAAYAY